MRKLYDIGDESSIEIRDYLRIPLGAELQMNPDTLHLEVDEVTIGLAYLRR